MDAVESRVARRLKGVLWRLDHVETLCAKQRAVIDVLVRTVENLTVNVVALSTPPAVVVVDAPADPQDIVSGGA